MGAGVYLLVGICLCGILWDWGGGGQGTEEWLFNFMSISSVYQPELPCGVPLAAYHPRLSAAAVCWGW